MSRQIGFVELRQLALSAIHHKISNGEFSERALARRARLSQPATHNLLHGKRTGQLETLDSLCSAADVRIAELIDPSSNPVTMTE